MSELPILEDKTCSEPEIMNYKIPLIWKFWNAVDKVLDKAFGKQIVATKFIEDTKVRFVRLIVLELVCKRMGIVTDEKGREWLFDSKHHQWIEVTMPAKLKGKMVKIE